MADVSKTNNQNSKREAKAKPEDPHVLKELVESGKLEQAMEHDVDPDHSATEEAIEVAEEARAKTPFDVRREEWQAKASELVENAKTMSSNMVSNAKVMGSSAVENAKTLSSDVRNRVQANPMNYVLGAAAVGIAWGLLRRRSKTRRSRY